MSLETLCSSQLVSEYIQTPSMDRGQQHSSVDDDDWEHKLRRYLLLLASLAATVTYAAGLDPPGGSWVESDGEGKAVAGDSILRATNHRRYLAFYYSNATAFAASLVVILLLLVFPAKNRPLGRHSFRLPFLRRAIHLGVLRLVMVLDLLALMVAYTAGSYQDKVATIYTVALVAALSAYVGYHFLEALRDSYFDNTPRPPRGGVESAEQLEQLRKVLMLLSIFAATIAYDAGLKPPGGFWEHTANGGLHRPGEVILNHKHGGRFAVFFFCNTTAFIASLFTVVLLLDKKLTATAKPRLIALYGFVLVTLVTLVAAYAAGSCRNTATTTYTVALVAAVLVSIFLAAVAGETAKWFMERLSAGFDQLSPKGNGEEPNKELKEKRSLVLLLGTLAASITYQAGLSPPGGVWLENQSGSHGHNTGDPVLLNTDNKRYTTFFYCNSAAFVASLVVILMVQIKALLRQKALQAAIMFDLVGLMGAYIAGSSRTVRASVHVIVIAAAVFVYGAYLRVNKFHTTPPTAATSTISNSEDPNDAGRRTSLKKRRKRLLLFAILMVTITYQAGLSPPGGCWRVEQEGHSSTVGSPILQDMYPRRYKAFFYCNAMSFMASIVLIVLLQDDKTYQPSGIRFYGVYALMLVGMLALMGAYAAGTARRVKTSIYVFVLVGGVSVFIALLLALFVLIRGAPTTTGNDTANGGRTAENNNGGDDNHRRRPDQTTRKYVMLLAMLAASVTYQAGLDPPGGVWPDGYAAGRPVLHDSNRRRYHIFFYSNSSSFIASIVVIILLLQSERRHINKCRHPQQQQEQRQQQQNVQSHKQPLLLMATNTVVALDLVGLLVAYAAGSSRTMDTSLYVAIVLVIAVVIFIVVYVRLPACFDVCEGERSNVTQASVSGEQHPNGANERHEQADAPPPSNSQVV